MAGSTRTSAAKAVLVSVLLSEPVNHDGEELAPGTVLVCSKEAAEALVANGAASIFDADAEAKAKADAEAKAKADAEAKAKADAEAQGGQQATLPT